MIIDGIRLYSAAQSSTPLALYAEFSLDRADTSQSYILQQGWGFDLDEINPSLFGSFEDDEYATMQPNDRLIVMKIKLQPQLVDDETPSSLRDNIYRIISATRTGLLELRLMNQGSPVAYIRGYMKKFESDLFSSEPVIQISINCPDPIFRGVTAVNPLSILEPSPPTIAEAVIEDNISTAPHGMLGALAFIADPVNSYFTIQGKYGTTEAPFRIDYQFQEDDFLYWDNTHEAKSLYVYRFPDTIKLLDKLHIGQVWPMIYPGYNRLGFSEPTKVGWWDLQYYHHFWGV